MANTSLGADRTTGSLDRYAQAVAVAVVALAATPALLVLGLPFAVDQLAFGGRVQTGSVATSVLLAVTAGTVAYRYAARAFETMTP